MKIDFAKPLISIKGTAMKATDAEDSPDFTLGEAAVAGLLFPKSTEDGGSQKEATKCFMLAVRIENTLKDDRERVLRGERLQGCEVDDTERLLIKDGIARAYGNAPAVCGPVEVLFDGAAIVRND